METAPGEVMALIRPIYSPWMWEVWAMGSTIEVRPNLVLSVYNDSLQGKMRAQFIGATGKQLEPVKREQILSGPGGTG